MKKIIILGMLLALPVFTAAESDLPLPTKEQAAWQDDEISMFFHFDIPVFTDGGRGNSDNWKACGHLNPDIFNPQKLDTDQWMEAAKALGAKHSVFVAKHCSGFILWQSDAYPYGLKQTKWRDGKGDILRDYVRSSRKAGIAPGIYISWPANAHWGVVDGKVEGGNSAKQAEYAKAYEKLITEAYGHYGRFCEIWFDGGVPSKEESGPDAVGILKKLQPQAVIFQGPVGTIRWIGNEDGVAPLPCWATVAKRNEADGGDPNGKIWQPGEADTTVRRNQWFWQPGSEHTLRGVEELMHIYYCSVGRNCNLILNANIDRDGRVPEVDIQRYREFAAEIKRRFGRSVAETNGKGDVVTLKLKKPTTVDHVIVMEDILQGERIRECVVEGLTGGEWKVLCKEQCIGHKRIDQFAPVEVSEVRLRVTLSVAPPIIRRLAVFDVAGSGK